ncbi:ATP-binding protein [Bradyrhizobium sp. DASA03005]|uniref:hybrid sensor histidine kinase/response regulator n=1 Tax=Bradyrhizobium sp. SPXBL-02 TaxID=3395912 RepID=UPI003F70518C
MTHEALKRSAGRLRDFFNPAAALDASKRNEVERLRLSDLAGRTPYWLAVLADACIIVWFFGTRDASASSVGMIAWTFGLIGALISYAFLSRWLARLPDDAPPGEIRRYHFIWCAWLTIVSAIWLSGNKVLAHQPAPYGVTFDLAQQTFVYLTFVGQFISVICFSPSVLAIFGVIVVANLIPFELHILQDLRHHNQGLSLLNTHIFFTGQLVMFFLVGWFFSISQKRFYIRQVLLRHERIQSELERSRAEAERIRANSFITAVGHDLKQPLQASALRLRSLKKKVANMPDLRETIEELERQNVSLHEMVDASFDLSRLNAGTWNVEPREAVLPAIVSMVLDEFQYQATHKGLALHSEPIPPVLVKTDPDALARVLRNLVGNAIKYTPSMSRGVAGRVALSCRQEDATIAISITDNGIGIPSDRAHEVFEPYVQLDNPSRDRAKGFGLGLSIVDRLIKLLDGHSIRLCQLPEGGSQFTVTLPFVARIPAELLERDNTEHAPNLAGTRVAIIEDQLSVRDAISDQLRDLGCSVYEGSTADEAMQSMIDSNDADSGPDFILADYRLAEGIDSGAHTGIDAIKRLRLQFAIEIPAVICTAETQPEILQMIAVEGLEVISKGPRMFDELLNTLTRLDRRSVPKNAAA